MCDVTDMVSDVVSLRAIPLKNVGGGTPLTLKNEGAGVDRRKKKEGAGGSADDPLFF